MGFETVPDAWGRLWDLRELERRDFDAARDWWESARLADGAYDEARDWWYGLTDEEREDIQSEYFERIYDVSMFIGNRPVSSCTGLVQALFDYHDVFNARPAELFGKAVTGEDLRCKLSRRQVELLRLTYPTKGVSLRQLARGFGVSPSTMWKVLHGHSWKE